MAFRRFAQENYAASPRTSSALPTTPRNRPSILSPHRSPAAMSSISSSVPFDWEAARCRKPPPYATPSKNRARKSIGAQAPGTQPRRAVIRKKGLIERITSIPSSIAFEIALFPHNVPLPSSKTSAHIIGATLHSLHFCIRFSQSRKVPDTDIGWEDMYQEENRSWFDSMLPLSCLLIAVSFANAVYLFSRTRVYRLHRQPEPVSSPNAKFISNNFDLEPEVPRAPFFKRILSGAWHAFVYFWRFLLGIRQPASLNTLSGKTTRVQELQVWNPGELELTLFSIYSPVHPFLWMATGTTNWILMLCVMFLVSFQLNVIMRAFNVLLKDKALIAAEVMNEYNQGYVYPRLHPIRKDVAVMTHQSELINVWED